MNCACRRTIGSAIHTNDYSVPPKALGRQIHLRVNDASVVVTLGTEVVACHDRVLAAHVTVTDPAHDHCTDFGPSAGRRPHTGDRHRRRGTRPERVRPRHRGGVIGDPRVHLPVPGTEEPIVVRRVRTPGRAGPGRGPRARKSSSPYASDEEVLTAPITTSREATLSGGTLPGPQDPRGLRLRPPAQRQRQRRRPPGRPGLHRSPIQRRVPRPAGHGQDASVDRPRHPILPGRPPRGLRHRGAVGGPPRRRP